MIKLPTREDFERLVKINTERNEWNHEYYAHLPARQQWKAWQVAIAEVQRLNATAQPVSDGWVKCSERMPESDGHYLVFANASTLDGYCDHNDIACYQQGKWSNEFNWLVTHWMPLPAAPGGQDD